MCSSDFAAERQHYDHLGAWIGLHRPKGKDSKWSWIDGSPLDFENWSTLSTEAKPAGVDKDQRWCVLIVNNRYDDHTQWNIRSCDKYSQTAICQKEL